MDIRLDVEGLGKVGEFMRLLRPEGRRHLNEVGANALSERVKRHLRTVAPSRHRTALALGAAPTGHIENAVAAVAPHADADGGEVVVPFAGASRAFRDIRLATPTPRGRRFYTIPKHRAAYGRTVAELRSRGWTVFRPGQRRVLLGYLRKGERPVVLYALAERVRIPRDPSLLPAPDEAARTVRDAMEAECRRLVRRAR